MGCPPKRGRVTYLVLTLMERVGLVWDLKRPTPEVVAGRLGRRSWLVKEEGAAAAPLPAPSPAKPVAGPVTV